MKHETELMSSLYVTDERGRHRTKAELVEFFLVRRPRKCERYPHIKIHFLLLPTF